MKCISIVVLTQKAKMVFCIFFCNPKIVWLKSLYSQPVEFSFLVVMAIECSYHSAARQAKTCLVSSPVLKMAEVNTNWVRLTVNLISNFNLILGPVNVSCRFVISYRILYFFLLQAACSEIKQHGCAMIHKRGSPLIIKHFQQFWLLLF